MTEKKQDKMAWITILYVLRKDTTEDMQLQILGKNKK